MSEIPDSVMQEARDIYHSAFYGTSSAPAVAIYEAIAKALFVERKAKDKPETRDHLRDCPFCHADGQNDEKVYLQKTVTIATDCEFVSGYSVFCTECGATIHDEYKDEVVARWNGVKAAPDDEVGED